MSNDFNYGNLRAADVVCTAATSLAGRLIRLYTAKLKNRNGIREAGRQKIANHCAIIIEMASRLWLAEMVDDGLKIHSMKRYLNNKREKIVAIKRHKKLTLIRGQVNARIIDLCQQTRDYDYAMILQYLKIGHDSEKNYYCSELCEVIANEFGATWDRYQLKRDAKRAMIAPVEIHFGAPEYSDFVTDFYV
jgi:hypothetical protein